MQAAQKLAQAEQELLDAQRLGLVMENAHPLIPRLSSAAARLKHDQDAWKLFARRIQRHPFVKAHIIRRDYENGCPWCDRPFTSTENLQVHHVRLVPLEAYHREVVRRPSVSKYFRSDVRYGSLADIELPRGP